MQLNPYLNFPGTCEEAINFYKDILDGEIKMLMRYSEAPPGSFEPPKGMEDKVMHCTLEFSGLTVLASDCHDGNYEPGNNCHLSLNIKSDEEAAKVFNDLAVGGAVTMPFNEVFWGGKFGMLTDKFGVHWMVSSEH